MFVLHILVTWRWRSSHICLKESSFCIIGKRAFKIAEIHGMAKWGPTKFIINSNSPSLLVCLVVHIYISKPLVFILNMLSSYEIISNQLLFYKQNFLNFEMTYFPRTTQICIPNSSFRLYHYTAVTNTFKLLFTFNYSSDTQ